MLCFAQEAKRISCPVLAWLSALVVALDGRWSLVDDLLRRESSLWINIGVMRTQPIFTLRNSRMAIKSEVAAAVRWGILFANSRFRPLPDDVYRIAFVLGRGGTCRCGAVVLVARENSS